MAEPISTERDTAAAANPLQIGLAVFVALSAAAALLVAGMLVGHRRDMDQGGSGSQGMRGAGGMMQGGDMMEGMGYDRPATSQEIYQAVVDELGEEAALFDGAYDIPLQLVATDASLRARVLAL